MRLLELQHKELGNKRRQRRPRQATVGQAVTRKVDSSGNVSFAASNYSVGLKHRRRQVQVPSLGELLRSHRVVRSSKSIPSVTTGHENTEPSPTRVAGHTASTPPKPHPGVEHRYRSQTGTRVPELDMMTNGVRLRLILDMVAPVGGFHFVDAAPVGGRHWLR